jgi:chemotaxis family two-component system sensor kinase Cph1
MGKLIDDLLAFSRISRYQLNTGEVDQDALVAGVVRDGRFEGEGRPSIEWSITPLPRVRADASMLRQVWANLIANAVKYSGKNPHPRIEISCTSVDGEYVFSVKDNGVGFDMAYAHKLFGVFQRLHGPSEFEGTGIGLANVRRIVTRHSGRTWAEGQVGEGAAFYFSLPRNQTSAS